MTIPSAVGNDLRNPLREEAEVRAFRHSVRAVSIKRSIERPQESIGRASYRLQDIAKEVRNLDHGFTLGNELTWCNSWPSQARSRGRERTPVVISAGQRRGLLRFTGAVDHAQLFHDIHYALTAAARVQNGMT
jgi:hypothetical protein